ncbi:hypothetical protein RYZ26_19275 [Terasakiella sp. A23]|uniref:hypothetical protein n=1 Tax=Terasakiella sp. FCG-A23 TaxID=3080561 RepID=UPI002955D5E1|nr:hypothetical protein [Terasakiella sp. A23]MDV7341751.1 hypothetical protein [Terasakiella sp. A23]
MMTTLYDALNWMQNGKLQLLILSIGDEDISSRILEKITVENKKFFFFDYRDFSSNPMCLYEIWLDNEIYNIENFIDKLIKNIVVNVDICFIFDGFIINSTDLFGKNAYQYIYAIKSQNISDTSFSKESRNSKNWLKKVTQFQKANLSSTVLGGSYQSSKNTLNAKD